MRLRSFLVVVTLVVIAVVLQTTLFSQTSLFIPDLVMLLVIVLAMTRTRSELVLGLAFLSGLTLDLLGSSVLGLRAIVFTVVGFVAIRTRDRAEIGRIVTGMWAAALTLGGVVLLLIVGTLFGQTVLLGDGATSKVVLVPLSNLILASAFAPFLVRLIDRDSTAFRYT